MFYYFIVDIIAASFGMILNAACVYKINFGCKNTQRQKTIPKFLNYFQIV